MQIPVLVGALDRPAFDRTQLCLYSKVIAGTHKRTDRADCFTCTTKVVGKFHDSVMEFGLTQLGTGLRPGPSSFRLSQHVEIARTCSNLVAERFKAKFHYAILVADMSEAGRRSASSC